MITTLVLFSLPSPISLEDAAKRFESSAPKYQNLKGLVRKYYVRTEDGSRAGGIYLWESRAAAEAVYNGEWRERVESQNTLGHSPRCCHQMAIGADKRRASQVVVDRAFP